MSHRLVNSHFLDCLNCLLYLLKSCLPSILRTYSNRCLIGFFASLTVNEGSFSSKDFLTRLSQTFLTKRLFFSFDYEEQGAEKAPTQEMKLIKSKFCFTSFIFHSPNSTSVQEPQQTLFFNLMNTFWEQLSFFYNYFCSALDLFEQFQILGHLTDYVDGTVWLRFTVEDAEGASHRPIG